MDHLAEEQNKKKRADINEFKRNMWKNCNGKYIRFKIIR